MLRGSHGTMLQLINKWDAEYMSPNKISKIRKKPMEKKVAHDYYVKEVKPTH